MEAKFVCTCECYPHKLCRVGDVVGAETASLAPACFHRLKSVKEADMKEEIRGILDNDYDNNEPVQMSNYELLKSRKVKVNGMKEE